MTAALEDTLGDIVEKARTGQKLSLREVAGQAGLSTANLEQIEHGGLIPPDAAVHRLAEALGLNGDRLVEIARDRWRPAPPPSALGNFVTVIEGSIGGYGVHAYLLHDRETGEAALVDTANAPDRVVATAKWAGLTLRHILLTHSHHDHAGGVGVIQEATAAAGAGGAPIMVGRAEAGTVRSLAKGTLVPVAEPVGSTVSLTIGRLTITVLSTAGHTPGGLTYVISHQGRPIAACVGDALFAGSVGRANDSYPRLLESVRTKILTLEEHVVLLPGHGPPTTVRDEVLHNPFARPFAKPDRSS